MGVAYLIFFLALVFTVVAFNRVRDAINSSDRERFDRAVAQTETVTERRMARCVDQAYNIRALFAASESVELDEWKAYLSTMSVRHNDLGIRTLGYLQKVLPEDKESFARSRSAANRTNVVVIPPGDRPVYFPIVYVTHFDPSAEVIYGLDHGSRPERLVTINQAIDQNKALMTGRTPFIGFAGTHTNSGYMVYLPVYRKGAPVATADQRREAAQGLIWITIIPQMMLSNLFDERMWSNPGVDIEIFDGPRTNMTAGQLIYHYDPTHHVAETDRHSTRRIVTMPVLNRQWTLSFSTTPEFDLNSPRYLQWLTLCGGLAMSFLLFGIARTQVHARTRAERDEAVLAIEKDQLAVTLFSIGDGVITTDVHARIVLINKIAESLAGWTQAEAKGKLLSEVFNVVHENTRKPAVSPVDKVLQTGQVSELGNHIVLIARDGTERAIADSAAPIRDSDGTVTGVVLVFRDVTEKQKDVDRQFRESKLESLGLLAGGIAHDFNNMLACIGGNIALARMPGTKPVDITAFLADAEKAAFRARDLTQQLLTFARGGQPIRTPAYLEKILRETCEFSVRGSNVQCVYDFGSDVRPVEIDEGQFRQVINNLVLNARQAMPDGGKLEVSLTNMKPGPPNPLPAGDYVKITVKDNGHGIKPEHLPKIFEPYFTTRKTGSGLGLATAYSIIRKHDGVLRVESSPGQGAAFQIYLPATERRVPPAVRPEQFRHFPHGGRILIMDDEIAMLKMLGSLLKRMGFETETALDGAEAIRRYVAAREEGHPFTAVIMDLTVPNGMGGREAVKQLREIDPSVKAIVSSGYSLDPVMANFGEHGFKGVIPKPFHPDELSRVLHEIL